MSTNAQAMVAKQPDLSNNNIPSIVNEVIRSPGKPLEPKTRSLMESKFGHDFGGVRVHTDSKAKTSTEAVNARAYTIGCDVVFGSGEYAAHTQEGNRLLSHELTHVVQQRRGGSRRPSLRPNNSLEKEADRAALTISQGTEQVMVSGASAPGLARQKKKSKSEANPSPIKDHHRLRVTVKRFGKIVMTFTEVSGGMTDVDKAMPLNFRRWAVHTEPKAMVRIYNSGIPLDINTEIIMKGDLNPCVFCDRFLSQISVNHEVLIQYEWKQAKRDRKMIHEKGLWRFDPERLWDRLPYREKPDPNKKEYIPELEDMAKYSKDAGRDSGKKRNVEVSHLQKAAKRSARSKRMRAFKKRRTALKRSLGGSRLSRKELTKQPAQTTTKGQVSTRQNRRALLSGGLIALGSAMILTTDYANQQQKAAVRTELLKIGPDIREQQRKYPDKWIVVYGRFGVTPKKHNPQLEGFISPEAQFYDTNIVIAESLEDAETNLKPVFSTGKYEARVIASFPPKSMLSANQEQIDKNDTDSPSLENRILIDGKETLIAIFMALNPWERSHLLDAFNQPVRANWLSRGLTQGYMIQYGSLQLWMPQNIYKLAKTTAKVAVTKYIYDRLRFISQYEIKISRRFSRLRNQPWYKKFWQSSVFDLDESLKNPMKKVKEFKNEAWSSFNEKNYHGAEDAIDNAVTELDIVWDALNQYELNQIDGFRARPEDPYAGYIYSDREEFRSTSTRWLISKAEKVLNPRQPKRIPKRSDTLKQTQQQSSFGTGQLIPGQTQKTEHSFFPGQTNNRRDEVKAQASNAEIWGRNLLRRVRELRISSPVHNASNDKKTKFLNKYSKFLREYSMWVGAVSQKLPEYKIHNYTAAQKLENAYIEIQEKINLITNDIHSNL